MTATADSPRVCRRILPVRLEEATVLSRPVCCCEILPRGLPGLVSINHTTYTVEINAELPDAGEPIVHGYRLFNASNYQTYDLDAGLTECSCGDFLFRRGRADGDGCKHVLGLRQLRDAGDL